MVKICSNSYPVSNEQQFSQYFEKYPFPLSSFQKHAIESIVEGQHILVTAHTGSGKTLPAEFAIEHFVSNKKKSFTHLLLKHYQIKNSMNLDKNSHIFHSEFLLAILKLILKLMFLL